MEFQTEKKIDFLLTIHFLFACKYECECECHHQCSALALVETIFPLYLIFNQLYKIPCSSSILLTKLNYQIRASNRIEAAIIAIIVYGYVINKMDCDCGHTHTPGSLKMQIECVSLSNCVGILGVFSFRCVYASNPIYSNIRTHSKNLMRMNDKRKFNRNATLVMEMKIAALILNSQISK